MENNSSSLLDRFNAWMKESVMIKLASIGFLILILLIPASWISSLMEERQNRATEVEAEVADKWSGAQTLTGPVLRIPFTEVTRTTQWQQGIQHDELVETERYAYFLPAALKADGEVMPKTLNRGIFDVAVYDSKVNLTAQFDPVSFDKWKVNEELIHWDQAQLLFGITDLRGIAETPLIQSGSKTYASEPVSDIGIRLHAVASTTDEYDHTRATSSEKSEGIAVDLDWDSPEDWQADFRVQLALKGSSRLYFVPAGKNTTVSLKGEWPSPSFDGKMLPTDREVTDSAFTATWKLLSYNRPFAQSWVDQEQNLGGSEFGVRLIIPADQYQKSIRTSKYGVLVILLAFTALFLVEITSRTRIHPFQYILIGAALIIYYTLLLSFSEHFGYNAAYAIASLATVSLLSLYSMTFLRSRGLVILFTSLMTVFYVFIFVIIQAEDYSLLLGSLGLFAIIAAIMYISRNINWYRDHQPGTTPMVQ